MSQKPILVICLRVLSITMVFVTACRPASFEIIPGKKENKVEDSGIPNEFGTGEDGPSGTEGPAIENPNTNAAPTARLEAIWGERSVTKVRAGSKVTLQPTFDTVDPDDIGISSCRNPGIVQAAYQSEGEDLGTATRQGGCESLQQDHTFNEIGEYLLELTVTTNENETARASMTLTVLAATADDWDLGGFTIVADPLLTRPNVGVVFTGHCETKTTNNITWAFGDEQIADGRIVTHTFATTGSYEVDALCVDKEGNERKSRLTIVVIDDQVTIPGSSTPGTPTANEPDPSEGSSGTPGDGGEGQPGQGLPGQVPGQNIPGQNL